MRRSFSYLLASMLVVGATFSQSVLGQEQVKVQKVYHPPEPYTAELKITRVQTLANGTTITHVTKQTRARDAQGRSVFIEAKLSEDGQETHSSTDVDDPVAGTHTTWNAVQKKATVVHHPPPDQRSGCWQAPDGYRESSTSVGISAMRVERPKPVREDLGYTTIQGVQAHGMRTTYLTPAGKAGNDQPLTRVIEDWNAPSFGLQVRRLVDDPRTGKLDQELVSLTRGEPDAALFQIPEGYEIVNQDMVPCKE